MPEPALDSKAKRLQNYFENCFDSVKGKSRFSRLSPTNFIPFNT